MKSLAANKGHTIAHQLSAWDPVQKKHTRTAAAGMPARGFFALAPDGNPIHDDVNKDMGVADGDGWVQAPVPGTAMREHILPLVGQVVYEIVEAGAPVNYRDFCPYFVVAAELVGGTED